MAERRAWTGAITSADDVRRLVNDGGLTRATVSALAEAVRPADDVEYRPDASRLLPCPPELAGLLPWPGLPRGSTITVSGSHSVLQLLLAAGMSQGAWAAVVGLPSFGILSAAELGVPVDRLALVPDPGPEWPTVVGALIDGVDLVVVHAPGQVAEKTVRSLQARARQRGAVLLTTSVWPSTDVQITTASRRWSGLERGRGRLKSQRLELTAAGRGKAARPRTATLTVGVPTEPLRIPPPPAEHRTEPTTRESPLWQHVVPNDPPADAWSDLQPRTLGVRTRR